MTPARLRELLAEAGYADGLLREMPSYNAQMPEVYPIITQQLRDMGSQAKFTPILGSAGFVPLLGGEYHFLMSWG